MLNETLFTVVSLHSWIPMLVHHGGTVVDWYLLQPCTIYARANLIYGEPLLIRVEIKVLTRYNSQF